MSDLQDFIAEASGITLHRLRVLKAFSHVPDSPLMDVLYNMTRPPLRTMRPGLEKAEPQQCAAPTIVRKGMVNYRRELYGLLNQPDEDSK